MEGIAIDMIEHTSIAAISSLSSFFRTRPNEIMDRHDECIGPSFEMNSLSGILP